MALIIEKDPRFKIPPNGVKIIEDSIKTLFSGTSQLRAFFDPSDREALEILTPHKIFYLILNDLTNGDPLEATRFFGWRYILFARGRPLAAAELRIDPLDLGVHFAGVSKRADVAASIDILNVIAPKVADDEYELRYLRVTDILFAGLWFHCAGHKEKDFVYQLPPFYKRSAVENSPTRASFVRFLDQRARNVRARFITRP